MSSFVDALYVPDAEWLVPTARTARPWDSHGQHGAPVAALVARSFERLAPTPGAQLARLTIDLLRPVPMSPLEVRAGIVRPGRSLTHVSAGVFADGVEVARASGALMRTTELALPEQAQTDEAPPGEAGSGEPARSGDHGFNALGCEIRFTSGGLHLRGPGEGWVRLRVPVVAGEATTPVMRAAAAADLGNGFSSMLSLRSWQYMSTDLSVHLSRPPVGEWIGLRSCSFLDGRGTGVTQTALFDERGRIGTATQSLLVDAVERA